MKVDDSPETALSRTSGELSDDLVEQTDRNLLTRIADGDKSALREFYLRHEMRVRRLLRWIGGSRDSVEETVLDTFLVIWREASKFRGDSRVLIWILGIAYRRRLAYLQSQLAWSEETVESDFNGDSSDIASRPEWLSRALLQLPLRQRAVIELTYGLGLSCDEVSSVMQCPMKTVKITLLQARRHLDLARATMPRE
jgi:RNA polymerase sigma-70 factor, ECF subfamily